MGQEGRKWIGVRWDRVNWICEGARYLELVGIEVRSYVMFENYG